MAPRHPNQDRFIKKGFIDDIAKIVDMREKFYIMPLKRMITKDSIDVIFNLSVEIFKKNDNNLIISKLDRSGRNLFL